MRECKNIPKFLMILLSNKRSNGLQVEFNCAHVGNSVTKHNICCAALGCGNIQIFIKMSGSECKQGSGQRSTTTNN